MQAMISSEVQRTLVKSPPELWAELSDPVALARHLGELGEIRIVRTEPERTVEWAAENTTGTVSIKPSGWGTKVTLSVTREAPATIPAPEPEAEAAPSTESEPEPALEAATGPEPQSEPEAATAPEPESQPEIATAPDPESETEPRRGFFARLFGRRRKGTAPRSVEQETTFEHPAAAEIKEPDPEPAATEPGPTGTDSEPTASKPEANADSEKAGDMSAELMAAEESGAEEVTAVLTAVLNRLGAAHHRPFSRS